MDTEAGSSGIVLGSAGLAISSMASVRGATNFLLRAIALCAPLLSTRSGRSGWSVFLFIAITLVYSGLNGPRGIEIGILCRLASHLCRKRRLSLDPSGIEMAPGGD